MQRKTPDSKVVAGALAVLAAFLVLLPAVGQEGLPAVGQEGPPPALVVTAPAVLEPITEKIELPGTVLPVRDSVVASEVEGRVAERAVENGQQIDRADILVRLDSSRLRQDLAVAEAQLAEVEAQLELSVIRENRARELHEGEVLSEHDLDEAMFSRQALASRRTATRAYIASIEDDIERTEIRAPFSGVITDLFTEVGEWVARGGAVVRLSDLDTLEIRLSVPERYYSMLHDKAETRVRIEALPHVELTGRVFSIVPLADGYSRAFPVLVRAKNPGGSVGAGMLCTVEVELTSGEPALLVPKDAIVRHAQREVLFVVEDGAVKLVPVRTGRADGERVEVFGELEVGTEVVVRGNERLMPGQPVQLDTSQGSTAPTHD